jgi:hypothetical protein
LSGKRKRDRAADDGAAACGQGNLAAEVEKIIHCRDLSFDALGRKARF